MTRPTARLPRPVCAPASRREFLARAANGFGAVALAAMSARDGFAGPIAAAVRDAGGRPTLPTGGHILPHHVARAKHVIFLYMDGGPSQVDTFDPKPRLQRESGQPFPMKMEPTQFDNNGAMLGSPWKFHRHGKSGLEISALFPHVARSADDLCVIRSMVSEFSEHTNANYFLHTGLGLSGRPSMGAWASYGLGSLNRDLPDFIAINGGLIPPGGLDCFGSGFLPATHQGSLFKATGTGVANVHPSEATVARQRTKLDIVRALDQHAVLRDGAAGAVESAILNHELAFRMQATVPELMALDDEPTALKERYGFEARFEPTRHYARQCMLARRLIERGVRFVELTCPRVGGHDRWDQHGGLRKGHAENAQTVDQPIGALLDDLRARGLLQETLVVFSGEFGRTPFAQGSDGRDHNPFGFSIWMAGGGIRGGQTYGATDEYGYKAIEDKVEIYDLHATMLYLLGVDHERLTFLFSGREMRLTDVHGHVIEPVLA